jgi:hypothetical protein
MISPAKTWSSASHITYPLQLKKEKRKEKEEKKKRRARNIWFD